MEQQLERHLDRSKKSGKGTLPPKQASGARPCGRKPPPSLATLPLSPRSLAASASETNRLPRAQVAKINEKLQSLAKVSVCPLP